MKQKIIHQILPPPPPHMVGDGFRVHNFFPSGYNMDEKRMSPFYLLDYNAKIDFSPREYPRGVGVHPHRGFETVTIAYYGSVAHQDSYGHSGIIGAGDVQWMTAGSGVLHKEYHEEEYSKAGGFFQMVQLWVNLPSEYKMTEPRYQEIIKEKMGVYLLPDAGGEVEVIAGSFKGVKGPASTFSPIEMWNLRLKKSAEIRFGLPENYNTGMLVIEGSATFNEQTAAQDHFVLFRNDGEEITIKANEDCVVLVLSGEPIDEPIYAYGPFLMNTKEEVEQAYKDFGTGKFGQLE